MQKRGQPFAYSVGILFYAYDSPGIVDADNKNAPFRICESAYRLANRRQVAKPAFELGLPGFAGLNAF